MNTKAVQVGSLLVQHVLSSDAESRVTREHSWHGYLFLAVLPLRLLAMDGRLIKVQTLEELNAEREVYRAQMGAGQDTQLVYYEVVDAGA